MAKLAAMDPAKQEAYLKYKAELEGMSGRKMDKMKDDMGKSMSSPGPTGAKALQRLIGAVKGMKAFRAAASAAPKTGGLAPSVASAAGDALKKAAAKAKPKPGAPPPAAGGGSSSPAPPAVGSKQAHSVPAGQPPPPGTPPGKTVPKGQPPPPRSGQGKAPPPKTGAPPPSVGSRQSKGPPPTPGKAPPPGPKKYTTPAKIIMSASGERMLVLPDGRVVPLGTAVAAAAAGGVDLTSVGGSASEDAIASDRSALDKLAAYVTKRMAAAAAMGGGGGAAPPLNAEDAPQESATSALKAGVSTNVITALLKNCEDRKEAGMRTGGGALPTALPAKVSDMGASLPPDSQDARGIAEQLSTDAAGDSPECVLGTAKLARGRGTVFLLKATDGLVVVTVEAKSKAVTPVGGLITASQGGHIIVTNDQRAYIAAGVTGTLKLQDDSIVLDASEALLDSLLLDIPEEEEEASSSGGGDTEHTGAKAADSGAGAATGVNGGKPTVSRAPKFAAAATAFLLPGKGGPTALQPGTKAPPNSTALRARDLFGNDQAALDAACSAAVSVFLATGDAGVAAAAATSQAQDALREQGQGGTVHAAAEDVLAAVLAGLPPAPEHFSEAARQKHTTALLHAALRKLTLHVPPFSASPNSSLAKDSSSSGQMGVRGGHDTHPHFDGGSGGPPSDETPPLTVTVATEASAEDALGGADSAKAALEIAEKVLKATGSRAAAKAAAKKAWMAAHAKDGGEGGSHAVDNAMAALDAVFDTPEGDEGGGLAASLQRTRVATKASVQLTGEGGADTEGGAVSSVLVADDSDEEEEGGGAHTSGGGVPRTTSTAGGGDRHTDTLFNMLGQSHSACDAAAAMAAKVLAATGSLDAAAAAGVAAAREALGGGGGGVSLGAESALRRLLRALPSPPEGLSPAQREDFVHQVLAGSMTRVQVAVRKGAGGVKYSTWGLKVSAHGSPSHALGVAGGAEGPHAPPFYAPQRRGSGTFITVDRTAKLSELFGGDDAILEEAVQTAAGVLAATGSQEAAVAAAVRAAQKAAKAKGLAQNMSHDIQAQLEALVKEAASSEQPGGTTDVAERLSAAARQRTVRVQAEIKLRDLTSRGANGGEGGSDDDEFDLSVEAGGPTPRGKQCTADASRSLPAPETVPCVFFDLVGKSDTAVDAAVTTACKVLAATGSLDAAAAAGVAAARDALGGGGGGVSLGAESALRRLLRALPPPPEGLSGTEIAAFQLQMLEAAARMTKLTMPREALQQNTERLHTTTSQLQPHADDRASSENLVFGEGGVGVLSAGENTPLHAVVAKAVVFTRDLPLWSLLANKQEFGAALTSAAARAAADVFAATGNSAMAAAAGWTAARRQALKLGVAVQNMSNRTEQELFKLIHRTTSAMAPGDSGDPGKAFHAISQAAAEATVQETVTGYIPERINREHRTAHGQTAVRSVEHDVAPSTNASMKHEHRTALQLLQSAGADAAAVQRLVQSAAAVFARTGNAVAAAAAAAEAALPSVHGLDGPPSADEIAAHEKVAVAVARLLQFLPPPPGPDASGLRWDQFRFFLQKAVEQSEVAVPCVPSEANDTEMQGDESRTANVAASSNTIRVPIERTTTVLRLMGGHDEVVGALLDTAAQVLAATGGSGTCALAASLAAARGATRARNVAHPTDASACVPAAAQDAMRQAMAHVLKTAGTEASAAGEGEGGSGAAEDVWWTALAEAVATLGVRVPDEAVLPAHVRAMQDSESHRPEHEQDHALRDLFCLHDAVVGAAQAAAQRALSGGGSPEQAAELAVQAAKHAAFELDLDQGVPDSAQFALQCVLASLPDPPADLQSGEPRAFFFGQVVAAAMASTRVTVGRTRLQLQQARFIADTKSRSDVVPPELLPAGVHVTASGMLVYTANGAPLDTDAAAWVWNEVLHQIVVGCAGGGPGGELYGLLKSGKPLQPAVAGDPSKGGARGFERSIRGLSRHDYLVQGGSSAGTALSPLLVAEAPLYTAILTPEGMVDRAAVAQVQQAAVQYLQEGAADGFNTASRFDVWRTVHKAARTLTQNKSLNEAWVKAVVTRGEGGVYTQVQGSSLTKSDPPSASAGAVWSADALCRRPASEGDSWNTLAGAMRGVKWAATASHAEIATLALSHHSAGRAIGEAFLLEQATAAASAWKRPLPPLPTPATPPSQGLLARRGVDDWRVSAAGVGANAGRHRLLHPPQPPRRRSAPPGQVASQASTQQTTITVTAFKGASATWKSALSHSEQLQLGTQSPRPSLPSCSSVPGVTPGSPVAQPTRPLLRHSVRGRGEVDMTAVDRHHPQRAPGRVGDRVALLGSPRLCSFNKEQERRSSSATNHPLPAPTMRVAASSKTLARMSVPISLALQDASIRDVLLEHNTRDDIQRLMLQRSLRIAPIAPPPGVAELFSSRLQDLDDDVQLVAGDDDGASAKPPHEGVHLELDLSSHPSASIVNSLTWQERPRSSVPGTESAVEEPLDGHSAELSTVESHHSPAHRSPTLHAVMPPSPGVRTLSETDGPASPGRRLQGGRGSGARDTAPPRRHTTFEAAGPSPPRTSPGNSRRRASDPPLPLKSKGPYKVYLPPGSPQRGPSHTGHSPPHRTISSPASEQAPFLSASVQPSPGFSLGAIPHSPRGGSPPPRVLSTPTPSNAQEADRFIPSAYRKAISPVFSNFNLNPQKHSGVPTKRRPQPFLPSPTLGRDEPPLIVAPARLPAHLPPAPPLHPPDRPQHISSRQLPGEERPALLAPAAQTGTRYRTWVSQPPPRQQPWSGSSPVKDMLRTAELWGEAVESPPPPHPPSSPARVDALPSVHMPLLDSSIPASADTVRATARLAESVAVQAAARRLAATSARDSARNAAAASDSSVRRHVRQLLQERKAAVRRLHGLPPAGDSREDDVASTISAWWEPSGRGPQPSEGGFPSYATPTDAPPPKNDSVAGAMSRASIPPPPSSALRPPPRSPSPSPEARHATMQAAAWAHELSSPPLEPELPPPDMDTGALDTRLLADRVRSQAAAAHVKATVLPGVFGSSAADPSTIRREIVRGAAADAERTEASRRQKQRARGGILDRGRGLSWEQRLAASSPPGGSASKPEKR